MKLFSTLKRPFLVLIPVLAIIGPGIISGSVDNDAGGIATYSLAGAHFGYSLLWIVFLTTFALAVTQEIGARMGIVTGKGLASLVRERFGIRWTAFIMVVLFIANIGVIAAEFAGIGASLEIFHIPRYVSVPFAAVAIYFFVSKGNFKSLERLFLLLSSFYIVYIVSAVLAKPDWGKALSSLVIPTFHLQKDYLLTVIAVIGTTITPWGQFFIQDYVVDKKLSVDDLRIERGDVFFGSFLTNVISFFIIVACAATIYVSGKSILTAADAAVALSPLAGHFATILFAFGLFNAAIFGAALVPVATSYVITEAFGFESGLNFAFREAPEFYILFGVSLGIGALLVILPFVPLLAVLFLTQALNAILLLPVFVFLYILANDKKILGSYSNHKITNGVVLLTFFLIAIVSLIYFISLFVFPT